jgi:diaminopimelate epimerase
MHIYAWSSAAPIPISPAGDMNFVKMHGCANDFVLTHEVSGGAMAALVAQAPALCDRRTGIGADGVILVLPSRTADLRMRIINADGSEAEMCGNGVRCFALYAALKGLYRGNALTVETLAGPVAVERRGEAFRVNMGSPVLDAARIPTTQQGGRVLMHPLEAGGRTFAVTAVSMGNPHAVVYADELSDELVLGIGPLLEKHPFFPRKVNVEFVTVLSPGEIRMRVFERGCGETMACGTGACAAAVAGVLNQRHGNHVTVHLRGGDLEVAWDGEPLHPVYMTGPAQVVFEGSVDVPVVG